MKRIIVTGSDEKYVDLTFGLLNSLNKLDKSAFDAVGMLDLGLSEETKKKMSSIVTHFVEPKWDIDVDEDIKLNKPHTRALFARPFLREYFPGYDLYLWIDADIWVQERFAIDWFFAAAQNGAMGLVPSQDVSYTYHPTHIQWRESNLYGYYGKEALMLYKIKTYYCAGAFALHHSAPHWAAWAQYFQKAMDADPTRICDQAALNYMLWKENLSVYPLPAICNWLCQYAIPNINRQDGKLREPYIPHRLIGMIHLAGKSKKFKFSIDTANGQKEFDLKYKEKGFVF